MIFLHGVAGLLEDDPVVSARQPGELELAVLLGFHREAAAGFDVAEADLHAFERVLLGIHDLPEDVVFAVLAEDRDGQEEGNEDSGDLCKRGWDVFS